MDIEILAPAGSAEALQAAVRCGAAAVYLGTDSFNARQHADNFAGDALRQAVEYCHLHGVKVHLTLNTLIRENEFSAVMDVAHRACDLGIDALIVQDVGLARCIHAAAPQMPLHASTQLSCHTPQGVAFLQENGFSRVVLSREMSLAEIKTCAGLGCELEVFVHGALCMCVSGQCYLSAALGGRSGNRGLCAQPCRLPFSAPDTANLTGGYALSLKDQSLTQYIPTLHEAGVTSFKIEGRMKRPEYVAAATTFCRAAAAGLPLPEHALQDLEAVFSRSGFTDGYLTGKRGTAMFGIRRQEDVTAAMPVLKKLAAQYAKEPQHVAITMNFQGAVDQESLLTVCDTDGHTVTVHGTPAARAHENATTADKVIAQLSKTGGTPYTATVTAVVDNEAIFPAADLNALRRQALEKLSILRTTVTPVPFNGVMPPIPPSPLPFTVSRRIVRLASATQYTVALQHEMLVLPIDTPLIVWQKLAQTQTLPFGVEIPRGLFGSSDSVLAALGEAKRAGVSFAVCPTCNAVQLAKVAELPMLGGFGLNITNTEAVQFYAANGLSALTLSPELSFVQMQFATQAELPLGIISYGRLPLMLTRNCPRKAAGADCTACHRNGVLVDRKKAAFPVQCQNGCAELLNSVPIYWGDKPQSIPSSLFQILYFTTETDTEITAILRSYNQCQPATFPFTRGMYRNGVE